MSGTIGGRWRGSAAAPVSRPRLPPVAEVASGWYELTGPPAPFDVSAPPSAALISGDASALVGAGSGSDDCWIYDFDADSYTSTAAAPSVGYRGGELIGTKSYMVDSTRAAYWESGSWTNRASHGFSLWVLCGMCEAGGLLYVLGHPAEFKSYDPGSNTWTTLSAPGGVSDVNVDNALFDAGGGFLYLVTESDTAYYEIGTDTWTGGVLAPRSTPIKGSAVGVIGSNVYFAGGYDLSNNGVDNLDIYSIGDDAWSSGPAMPDGTLTDVETLAPGVVHDGALYVFGYNGSPGFELWARKYVP